MKREEFYQRAVIELSAAMVNNGAWKLQLSAAMQMAEYLTFEVYGEWILPEHTPTTHIPIVAP